MQYQKGDRVRWICHGFEAPDVGDLGTVMNYAKKGKFESKPCVDVLFDEDKHPDAEWRPPLASEGEPAFWNVPVELIEKA